MSLSLKRLKHSVRDRLGRGGDLLQKPDLGFNFIYIHERLLR